MTSHLPKNMEVKLLSPYITCKICKGYFIDATTVTECLHTFCRSCIVKHFKKSLFCPECDVQVERGCPLNKLRPDPRKQLLVYKVVPRLHENEVARQWNFLKQNQPNGLRPLLPGDLSQETIRDRIVDKINLYSPEDKISLSVEYESNIPFGSINGGCSSDKPIYSHKRYLQCPAALLVFHLKKFIRLKYEISTQHKIMILYEGEPLAENTSLMDVAYQFFYEAKSPMRFTYRIIAGVVLKATENFNPKPKPLSAKSPTSQPTAPARSTPSTQTAAVTRHTLRGSASSAASSSDESSASSRRQQRQRSAKTAAYNAMEAMEESDHEEQDPPSKRRRLAGKSPRWELEAESCEPFTVYRNTRRTPKATLEDLEARYNTKPERKRVYAACSDDEVSSDVETKRNTLANQKPSTKYNHLLSLLNAKGTNTPKSKSVLNGKSRRKKSDEDVYEFDAQTEDNDSNTTQEFDFVYENSDHEDSHSENDKKKGVNGDSGVNHTVPATTGNLNGTNETATPLEGEDYMNDVDADEHELEQHIEMEVITDTDDIDQHIEDSIEEVEVDAEDERDEDAAAQADVEAVTAEEDEEENDSHFEAETTSSTCLVIAEDEDDDGLVEEVIAAEEDGHELVVVEDPDENDVTYTVEVFNVPTPNTDISEKLSEDASHSSSGDSHKSKSPTAEEDEPEIVHERIRKKSKKSKHHHHHHHHKRRRHHSPVMLISSPEEAPMKLTLKLRPTPSISPGSCSPRNSNKSPMPESPTKEKKHSFGSPSRRDSIEENLLKSGSSDRSYKYNSQKVYTVKITSPKESPSAECSEKKFVTSNSDIQKMPSPRPEPHLAKPLNSERLSPKVASSAQGLKENQNSLSSSPKAASTYPRPPTPASLEQKKNDSTSEKRLVPDEVKERLTQMRQVRHKTSPKVSPTSASEKDPSSCVPDLKSVKTPSSLTISKVEAGETPPRSQEPSSKPALEILMLPPSPPSAKQNEEPNGFLNGSEASTKKVKKSEAISPVRVTNQVSKAPAKLEMRSTTSEQPCVLDLSDKTRREVPPKPSPPSPLAAPAHKKKTQSTAPVTNREIAVRNDHLNTTSQQNLSMFPDPLLAALATMNRMNSIMNSNQRLQKLPMLSPFCPPTSQQSPIQTLNEMCGSRQISGFSIPPSPTRPGPNQSVRHIPNPSALLHRQQQSLQQAQEKLIPDTLSKQPGQLTEEELKERLLQFQQNRAARANFTYSRVSSPGMNRSRNVLTNSLATGAIGTTATTASNAIPINTINNNLLAKSAARSRSIEKVAAGLLSVRAGAYAVEAQVGH